MISVDDFEKRIAYCGHKDVVDRKQLKELADKGVEHLVAKCTGLDKIDLNAAEGYGIKVHSIPGYSTNAVAQHSIWMALELMRPLKEEKPGIELEGKKVFIIGYGRIGKKIRQYLKGFDCQVIWHDIQHSHTRLMQYLAWADIVFLATALTPETNRLIRKSQYNAMKKDCVVVNCARRELLDLSVFDITWDKKLRLAIDEELTLNENALMDNASGLMYIWTNHNAYYTGEALAKRELLFQKTIKKIKKGLK